MIRVEDGDHTGDGGEGFGVALERALRATENPTLVLEEVAPLTDAEDLNDRTRRTEAAFRALLDGAATHEDGWLLVDEDRMDHDEALLDRLDADPADLDGVPVPVRGALGVVAERVAHDPDRVEDVRFPPPFDDRLVERMQTFVETHRETGDGAAAVDRLGPEWMAAFAGGRSVHVAAFLRDEFETGGLDAANTVLVRGSGHLAGELLADDVPVRDARPGGGLPAFYDEADFDVPDASVSAAAFAGGPPDPVHGDPEPPDWVVRTVDEAALRARLDERGRVPSGLGDGVEAAHRASPDPSGAALARHAGVGVDVADRTVARRHAVDWTRADLAGDEALRAAAELGARLDERGVAVDDDALVAGVARAHERRDDPRPVDVAGAAADAVAETERQTLRAAAFRTVGFGERAGGDAERAR